VTDSTSSNPAGAGAKFGENMMNLFLDLTTIHRWN